jgi:Ohr subfamily peroxiredoxin
METTKKVLYTAKVHTTGGRDGGASLSDDHRIDIKYSLPGSPGNGTNPEQMFAAGWSACFEGAMGIAAKKMRVTLPPDLAIDAEVDLVLTGDAFSLQARLNISLPGIDREVAKAIAEASENICPYSKAIRNNVPVQINIV